MLGHIDSKRNGFESSEALHRKIWVSKADIIFSNWKKKKVALILWFHFQNTKKVAKLFLILC